MMNSEDSAYCKKCGAPLRTVQADDSFRRHRHHDHDHRGAGSGFGALIIGAIVIVAGLGILMPDIPWDLFWASLLVLLGAWIIGFWLLRSYRATPKPQGANV
jgi:hypothetical protein